MRKRSNKSTTLEPSQRQLRVAEQIRHIISETLQRGHFNNTLLLDRSNTITVSEVRISPDLRHARAYVMSFGGEGLDEILPALNDEKNVFQKAVARVSTMKFTPRIHFVTDETFDNAEHIENLLRGLHIPHDDEDVINEEE